MRFGKVVSLIIPTLNEEDNLPTVLGMIPEWVDEIIVVDGHSKDKTVEIAQQHGCTVIFDDKGKGSAVILGVQKALGGYIIMMDADLSHRVSEFGLLIEGLDAGYDFCFGSRFIQGGGSDDMPLHRILGNKIFILTVNFIWGSRFTDLCYGYRSFRKDAFEKLRLKSHGFSIETEMSIKALKKNMRILEIPSFEKARSAGVGKLRTIRDGFIITKKIISEWLSD